MTQPTRPSQPFSMTIRLGGRKMTLTWRPRRALPAFLRSLLARARRVLFGALGAGALSGTALAAGALPGGALPNFNALVAGQAQLSQNGNQLTIAQGSNQAILNWNSFNIGNQASVRFVQPGVDSVALNRVLSNDPSSLLGQLSANGKVWLINPAGILVGQGARIDVGGFVASTLPVRDEDFLAKRLSFGSTAAATGVVRNDGRITTPQGGSVYLVGAGVENAGLIRAPGGEVLLAAGQRVQLVDTGTPGVKVEITGADGAATNLGQIASSAGRIGLAAGLVKNAGTLDASSVVEQGGRIFLKASGTLVTEASSRIAADGTAGGSVTLYADDSARLAGTISATGSFGPGGFVETSGKRVLTLAKAPTVGAGGTWLIDPDNITIQDSSGDSSISPTSSGDIFYSSTGAGAILSTSTVNAQLNNGVSVHVTTGANSAEAGDITVNGAITKSAGADATLTLSAHHDINLNAPIKSNTGVLNLNLIADSQSSGSGSVNLSSELSLNGGVLNISRPAVLNGATLGALSWTPSNTVSFVGGTNKLDVDLSVTDATLSGGTLTGSGKLTATNLAWSDGTIKGSSTDLPHEVQNLTLSGRTTTLDGRGLSLLGSSNATGATLTLTGGTTLRNGGVLTLSDSQIGADATSNSTNHIINSGIISTASGANQLGGVIRGTSTSTATASFDNTGLLKVGETLSMPGGVENGGEIVLAQSSVDLPRLSTDGATLHNKSGGTLSGQGTFDVGTGLLFNEGTVAPGTAAGGDRVASIGNMSVEGDFEQGAGGVLKFKLQDGSVADQLTVSGTTKLAGTLVAEAMPNYTPASGDALILIKGSETARSGAFGQTTLPATLSLGYGLFQGEVMRLAYTGPNDVYFSNVAGDFDWAKEGNWSGKALPGSTDQVVIDTEFTVQHAQGNDNIGALALRSGTLNISGGSLSIQGAAAIDGILKTSGGSLTLAGTLNGSGALSVEGGSAMLSASGETGSNHIDTLGVTAGQLNVERDLSVSTASVDGGALQGGGALSIGHLYWGGGTIRGVPGDPAV